MTTEVPAELEDISNIHARAETSLGRHQRLIERTTNLLARPKTFYVLVGVTLGWALVNELMLWAGANPIEPAPFFLLQGALAAYGALVGTLVLITQTRQQRHAEQRAYLELQINMVAERKIAKLIALVEELRRDLPNVPNRVDHQANSMTESVDTKAVLSALEATLETSQGSSAPAPESSSD